MSYGEMLHQWRTLSAITQQELSEAVGCSDSYIAHIENELKIPSLDISMALVQVLKLTPTEQQEFFDAIDAARRQRVEKRIHTRGLAVRGALRAQQGVTTTSQEPTSEDRDAERVAHDFAEDPDLKVAYEHLKACLAAPDPEIGKTILNTLRTFAEATRKGGK